MSYNTVIMSYYGIFPVLAQWFIEDYRESYLHGLEAGLNAGYFKRLLFLKCIMKTLSNVILILCALWIVHSGQNKKWIASSYFL